MAFERSINISVETNNAEKNINSLNSAFAKADQGSSQLSGSALKAAKNISSLGDFSSSSGKFVADLGRTSATTAKSVDSLSAATSKVASSSAKAGKGIAGVSRNAGQASIQVQQFVGQVQGGVDATVALSQQAADLGIVLGAPLVGAVVGIAAALAGPLVSSLVESTDLIDEARESANQLGDDFDDLVENIGNLTAAQKEFIALQAQDEIAKSTAATGDLSKQIIQAEANVRRWQARVNIGAKDAKESLDEAKLEAAALSATFDTLTKSIEQNEKRLKLATGELKISTDEEKRKAEAQEIANRSARRAVKALIDERDAFEAGARELFIYRKTKDEIALIEASNLKDKGALVEIVKDEAAAIFDANKKRKDQIKLERDLAKVARESDKAYEKLYDNLSDNLTDVILGYKDLEDVALSVAQNIARAFVQQNITAPILSAAGFAQSGGVGDGQSFGATDALSAANNILNPGGAGLAVGFGNFATSSLGQSLGLSAATSGAQFASQYGLTTGVAAGGTTLTSAGSFIQGGLANAGAGGLGGLTAGLLGLGSGNAVQDTVLSSAGTAIGAAIGGPVGAAIGGFLGTSVSGLFGGKPSDKAQLAEIDVDTDTLTIGGNEGDKFSQENRDAAEALGASALGVISALEAVTGDQVVQDYTVVVGSRDGIRLYDPTAQGDGFGGQVVNESTVQAFTDQVSQLFADQLDVNLDSFKTLSNEGELLADTIIRVTNQAQLAGPLLDIIGVNIGGLGNTALSSANVLIEAVGGLDALAATTQFYYANFFSEEERAQVVRDSAQSAVDDFNATLGLTGESAIDTRDELRGYIESIDATTSAGASAAGVALTLADEIAVLDQNTDELVDSVEELVDTTSLQIELLELQGREEEALALARQKELSAATESERIILNQIFAQEDLNQANEESVRLAEEESNLIKSLNALEVELLKAQGDEISALALIRQREIESASDSEAAILRQIFAQEDLNAANELAISLLDAQGRSSEVINIRRRQQLEGASEYEQSILRQIFVQEDFNRITDLNTRLLQTQGRDAESLAASRMAEFASASEAERVVLRRIYAQENLNAAIEAETQRQGELISEAGQVFSFLSEKIGEQRDIIEDSFSDQISSANEAISSTRSIVSTLNSAVDNLRLNTDRLASQTRFAAQSFIRNALISSGLPDERSLNRALSVLAEPSEDLFGTFEDYARDFVTTAKDIDRLQDKASSQLTVEEETLAAIELQKTEQLDALDNILVESREQIEQLEDINGGLISIEDAINRIDRLVDQASESDDTSPTGVTDQQIRDFVDANDVTPDRISDDEARIIYDAALATGTSLSQIDTALGLDSGEAEQWAIRNGLPTFANGGVFGGGVRMVGERGPELEFTGPSRIMSNSDMNDMMTNDSVVRELRELREITTSALMAVASNTKAIADINRAWDGDGLPQDRGY